MTPHYQGPHREEFARSVAMARTIAGLDRAGTQEGDPG